MENLLTKQNVEDNLRENLKVDNKNRIDITNETVLSSILTEIPGIQGTPSSKQRFVDATEWIIDQNGGTKIEWPDKWEKLTVSELADFIISKQVYE